MCDLLFTYNNLHNTTINIQILANNDIYTSLVSHALSALRAELLSSIFRFRNLSWNIS